MSVTLEGLHFILAASIVEEIKGIITIRSIAIGIHDAVAVSIDAAATSIIYGHINFVVISFAARVGSESGCEELK